MPCWLPVRVLIRTGTLSLLEMFLKLVALSYWWPKNENYRPKLYKYIHGSHSKLYFKDLQDLFKLSVKNMAEICCIFSYARKLLGQQKIHRLMALYVHIVPLNEHAVFVFSLTIKENHYHLQFAILKCLSASNHQFDVHQLRSKDWFLSMYEVHKLASISDASVAKYSKIVLRWLLFGFDELSCDLDIASSNTSLFISQKQGRPTTLHRKLPRETS